MAESPLLTVIDATIQFGIEPLFTDLSIAVQPLERVALLGRNGSGKSTLLKMCAGIQMPDSGEVVSNRGARAAYVPQHDQFGECETVAEVLRSALVETGVAPHAIEGPVRITLGKTGFSDPNQHVDELSGGWRKRLAIARGLVVEPDLLLLDEPTNHLDIDGILWLEGVLAKVQAAVFFVSHDRMFIEHVARRIIDLAHYYPGGSFVSEGGYTKYTEKREEFLDNLARNRATTANKARTELAWLRQGAKARSTKSKHRSAVANALQDEARSNKSLPGKISAKVDISFTGSERKSNDLLRVEDISKSIAGRTLFQKVSFTVRPGDCVGIVGPNGSGKTTLLKVLLGELEPDLGSVIPAPKLRVGHLDQGRTQLDTSLTLHKALCKEGDAVVFEGSEIHIASWAERFLFSREQLLLPVASLSGGEKVRVLLAQMMLESNDILVFDEPTNDLDIATLEVLQESILSYPGGVILVSHDRYLLEQTTSIIVGLAPSKSMMFGDYMQWEKAIVENFNNTSATSKKSGDSRAQSGPNKSQQTGQSRSGKPRKEIDAVERKIATAEAKLTELEATLSDPVKSLDLQWLAAQCKAIADQQGVIDELYAAWVTLGNG